MTSSNEHWNAIFSSKMDSELGWYERDASQTIKFLGLIPELHTATVFLPGAGTSVLVNELLPRCAHLVLNDISDEALNKLQGRIKNTEKVSWLHHDISKPLPKDTPVADVWIDRAVLHFLLDEEQIDSYFDNLRSGLSPAGYALLAEFATEGAPKCAGLTLHRYSIEEMTERIGPEFTLLRGEKYTFVNPFGELRPYVYALYKRNKKIVSRAFQEKVYPQITQIDADFWKKLVNYRTGARHSYQRQCCILNLWKSA
jgi:EEF1A lysine methyltransferase 2